MVQLLSNSYYGSRQVRRVKAPDLLDPNHLGCFDECRTGCPHPAWLKRVMMRAAATDLKTTWVARLLAVVFVSALSATTQAQFSYTTNNNTITIIGYAGP